MIRTTVFARFAQDKFFRDNAVFFVTTMTASVLSYLLHPALARVLSLQEYGEVQALLSLYSNLTIVIGIFSSVAMNIVANTDGHDHRDVAERMRLITVLRKIVLAIAALEVVVVLAMSRTLQSFFRFDDWHPFAALATMFLLTALMSFRRAFLRGAGRFGELGASRIVETATRLVFGAALAATALQAFGAAIGILIAQTVTVAFIFSRTSKEFRYVPGVGVSFDAGVRRELRFALLILVVNAALTALSTADVLIVKHFFPAHEAGMYSGISTIAHIVLFVSGSVGGVLMPSVKLKAPPEENRRLLLKALALIALIGGATLCVFVLAPRLVISIFIGSRYLPGADLLPRLSLLMFLLSLIGPMFSYDVALRRTFSAWMGGAGVIAILVWSWLDHVSPAAIVDHFLATIAALALVYAVRAVFFSERHAYAAP